MEETTIDLREVLEIIPRNIKMIGKITLGVRRVSGVVFAYCFSG